MSKRLIFFGNERLATGVSTTTPILRGLTEAGWPVAAVVTNYTNPLSRNARALEIAQTAEQNSIPLLTPRRTVEIKDKLASLKAEAGILVAYGQIIPQDIIDIFPAGIINLHPSLLPAYRGPTPIETAILDGVSETGVSLMALQAKMDAGPVYAQKPTAVKAGITKQELADQLASAGASLLLDNLPAILDGSIEPKTQAEKLASYTSLIKKGSGRIDWLAPAAVIERQVRAYAGWPKSQAEVFGQKIVIIKAREAENASDGSLVMAARPGWLEIEELIGPSGRTMSGADFIRGYRRA
ncbi:MAG TPA: methionyl-tRNA formyltransferase [Candidatus Saccharimonadales bacterium]|nr:methionyl-tRNA formyltransferase [Candidatus Saccharimonadales bacterium]